MPVKFAKSKVLPPLLLMWVLWYEYLKHNVIYTKKKVVGAYLLVVCRYRWLLTFENTRAGTAAAAALCVK